MLSHCFRCARVRERIRANPLGFELEQLTAHLLESGYCHGTIQQYLQAAEHFGRWLGRVGRSRPIDEPLVRRFLDEHLPRCRCRNLRSSHRIPVRAALKHLLRLVAARRGKGSGTAAAITSIETFIQLFDQYMRDACGLSAATRLYRRRYAREFLAAKFGRRPVDFHRLGPTDPMGFVADYAARCSPATAQTAGSSLRCFLRFLQWKGWCDGRLVQAVPSVPRWELSSFPKVMSEQELRQFLNSFDRSTATGRRDYAMALCMVDLGLRVSDVVKLCLPDIDWRQATLRIVGGKSRRSGILPLPQRVGHPRLRVRRYECAECQTEIVSHFVFDGLVFDAEYFRQKMIVHRERAREQLDRVRAMLAESRSSVLTPLPLDLSSSPGLLDALDGLSGEFRGLDMFAVEAAGFDLRRYQAHVQAHIGLNPLSIDEIPPMEEDSRCDRIWRFIAIVFLMHEGLLLAWQEGSDVMVMQCETNREGQDIPGDLEEADGVEGFMG